MGTSAVILWDIPSTAGRQQLSSPLVPAWDSEVRDSSREEGLLLASSSLRALFVT